MTSNLSASISSSKHPLKTSRGFRSKMKRRRMWQISSSTDKSKATRQTSSHRRAVSSRHSKTWWIKWASGIREIRRGLKNWSFRGLKNSLPIQETWLLMTLRTNLLRHGSISWISPTTDGYSKDQATRISKWSTLSWFKTFFRITTIMLSRCSLKTRGKFKSRQSSKWSTSWGLRSQRKSRQSSHLLVARRYHPAAWSNLMP